MQSRCFICTKSYMFGDNESIRSSTILHAKLHKHHQTLSFHRIREAIATGIVGFYHIPGVTNPADLLSKHWGYPQVWDVLKPLLFWQGDIANLVKSEPDPAKNKSSGD